MSIEVSNSLVVYLRFVTSAHIRNHEEEFAPFLMNPELQILLPASTFCESFVEATGKEAGQLLHRSRCPYLMNHLACRSCSNHGNRPGLDTRSEYCVSGWPQ